MGWLLDTLDSYCLGNEVEDERIWVMVETYGILVKSLYVVLSHGEHSVFPFKFIGDLFIRTDVACVVQRMNLPAICSCFAGSLGFRLGQI